MIFTIIICVQWHLHRFSQNWSDFHRVLSSEVPQYAKENPHCLYTWDTDISILPPLLHGLKKPSLFKYVYIYIYPC